MGQLAVMAICHTGTRGPGAAQTPVTAGVDIGGHYTDNQGSNVDISRLLTDTSLGILLILQSKIMQTCVK